MGSAHLKNTVNIDGLRHCDTTVCFTICYPIVSAIISFLPNFRSLTPISSHCPVLNHL